MGRDPRLWKRNVLVITGGILALLAAACLLYYLGLHRGSPSCPKYTQVMVSSTCYNTTPFLAGALILGIILVVVGAVVFRSKPTTLVDRLHHGTPAHFGLAALAALVVLPILAYIVVLYLERSRGTNYVLSWNSGAGTAAIPLHTIILALLVVGLVAFVPYFLLLLSQGRLRRHFLKEAESYEEPEAFPGEAGVSTESTTQTTLTEGPPAEEYVEPSMWPGSREPEVEVGTGTTVPAEPETSGTATAAAATTAVPPAPVHTGAKAVGQRKTAPVVQPAPMVRQAAGCRAMTASGSECGDPVGPGGRYCLRHACQGRTASGTPCRNPAIEGGTRCRAHSAS